MINTEVVTKIMTDLLSGKDLDVRVEVLDRGTGQTLYSFMPIEQPVHLGDHISITHTVGVEVSSS